MHPTQSLLLLPALLAAAVAVSSQSLTSPSPKSMITPIVVVEGTIHSLASRLESDSSSIRSKLESDSSSIRSKIESISSSINSEIGGPNTNSAAVVTATTTTDGNGRVVTTSVGVRSTPSNGAVGTGRNLVAAGGLVGAGAVVVALL